MARMRPYVVCAYVPIVQPNFFSVNSNSLLYKVVASFVRSSFRCHHKNISQNGNRKVLLRRKSRRHATEFLVYISSIS